MSQWVHLLLYLKAALLILAKPRPAYNYIEINMCDNLPVRM